MVNTNTQYINKRSYNIHHLPLTNEDKPKKPKKKIIKLNKHSTRNH